MISLSSPLKIGIYKDSILIKEYCKNEQTSEILPTVFMEILQMYKIDTLFFANGPGSFMAIKVAYIFLKSLSVTLGTQLLGCDGFVFNNNRPIRAMKRVYFVKKDDKIVTEVMLRDIEQSFNLPSVLEKNLFSKDSEPLYILPAV